VDKILVNPNNFITCMLLITVPSAGKSNLKFSTFEDINIPAPLSGIDAEINEDVILKFENEEEAVNYAGQLEDLSSELNNKSSIQNIAINDVILAIRNDEFVQSYLQNN
jgi:hypothetical protein